MVAKQQSYVFGGYRLDRSTFALSEGERTVPVEPQVFAVLAALIENRHRVVLKDELIELVWKGRAVSDAAISSRIKSARQAIGDSGREQRWIKTIHGLGFRFVGEVASSAGSMPDVSEAEQPTPPVERLGDEQKGLEDDRPSIVVLPFSLAGEAGQSIVPEGLAHDITTSLSRLRWLRVIARGSAFRLVHGSISRSDIRSLVGADYCLGGFLEVISGGYALHLELADMGADTLLWGETFRCGADELQELRGELVSRIIGSLELQIADQQLRQARLKRTDSLTAWESYHLGMSHFYRFTPADNRQAVALFQRSVALDPGFARAHAGLSSAAFQDAFNGYPGVDRLKAVEQAMTHAERSVEIDRMDPLANFVRGRVHWLTGEPGASLPWLERAVSLNPSFAQGYYAHGLASLLSSDGLRAYDDSDHALNLSPLDPFLYGFYGIRAFSFLADGDPENAHRWAEKSARQPGALPVMDLLAAATSDGVGDGERARHWLARAHGRATAIDRNRFFAALPFADGRIRVTLTRAFDRLGV